MPTENKPTKPLKVERSTVTKLVITGAPRLDTITVFLEDFGPRDCPTESNPNYSKDEARELWHDIDVLRSVDSPNECWHHNKLLTELFEDEWHYPVERNAGEENHEFTNLRRVVEAVQGALRQER
ncbi:hypothetical protein [Pseudomonas putida]|uniref:hypothetical protein n=1 Tax=Pseudomonas putida TaxID=303 RepID=UPI0015768FD0|nr:hypothetical protein [Pseudomonas putida]NTY92964.1 hypothetical protein [Pseudomonas putida]NTZ01153.1 hypothetical protein [Pseudomonas putida]NTZ22498.1 hypothetical protein [Pseudomonas putida]NTZ55236.1 hypothetical protein [Pseudomonas putida]NTZ64950.1 hypothetical protein [Pseudomonas putida]